MMMVVKIMMVSGRRSAAFTLHIMQLFFGSNLIPPVTTLQ